MNKQQYRKDLQFIFMATAKGVRLSVINGQLIADGATELLRPNEQSELSERSDALIPAAIRWEQDVRDGKINIPRVCKSKDTERPESSGIVHLPSGLTAYLRAEVAPPHIARRWMSQRGETSVIFEDTSHA